MLEYKKQFAKYCTHIELYKMGGFIFLLPHGTLHQNTEENQPGTEQTQGQFPVRKTNPITNVGIQMHHILSIHQISTQVEQFN